MYTIHMYVSKLGNPWMTNTQNDSSICGPLLPHQSIELWQITPAPRCDKITRWKTCLSTRWNTPCIPTFRSLDILKNIRFTTFDTCGLPLFKHL